ncbi:MAG: TetR/AcrR family transcriptional regulator [Sphingorhabdus sp.]
MVSTKNEERRSAIVERLADHILAHGLIAASLRPLAQAAGTSDRMLLYYFEDKAEIIRATLQRIAERMTIALAEQSAPDPLPYDALVSRLSAILFDDRFWPYMCVWLELASRSARKDPLYVPIAEAIGQGFLAWGETQLKASDAKTRAKDAAKLLVVIEGMVLVNAIGLVDAAKASID